MRPRIRAAGVRRYAGTRSTIRAPKIDLASGGVNFDRRRLNLAILAALAAWSSVSCASPSRPAPVDAGAFWPTHLGNSARAPFLDVRVTEDTPQVVWSAEVGAGLRGMPVAFADVIVASGTDRYIYAISRQDGSTFWRKRLEGPPSPPLVIGSVIFTATEDNGRLRTLGVETGDETWKQDFPSVSTTMSLSGDTLYVATEDAFIYAIDTGDKGQIWRTGLRQPAITGPLVVDGWVAYITADSLHLIDRFDGFHRSAEELRERIAGEAATDGKVIYAATEAGSVIAWSVPELELLWQTSGFDDFYAGPVLADSTGYALSRSGQLVRFEAANGSARVIAAVGETVISSPSVARNGVLFGTLQGTLYFFGRNGEPIWDVQLGGSIQAPAILYEGRIVVPMYGRVAGSFGSNPARGKVMELR